MSQFSLYQRFLNQGTLSQNKVPDPRYALPSTVNWMRAIAILVKDEKLNYARAVKFFNRVSKSTMSPPGENSVFEHLLLATHQLAALRALEDVTTQSDIVRVASVGWYYGIYAAASSMIAAQDGTIQDNHRQTANAWDRQLVQRGLILHPFDQRVSTLVKKDAEAEIDNFRRSPKANLITKPVTVEDAHQAICGYLSGTTDWWGSIVKERLKESRDFRKLGASDFRTGGARALRDDRLSKHSVSFLHQAYRFRGKANYREALYLAHGAHVETAISGLVTDMADILEAFLSMAGAFAFKRLGSDLTKAFLEDLDHHRSFSLDHRTIWT